MISIGVILTIISSLYDIRTNCCLHVCFTRTKISNFPIFRYSNICNVIWIWNSCTNQRYCTLIHPKFIVLQNDRWLLFAHSMKYTLNYTHIAHWNKYNIFGCSQIERSIHRYCLFHCSMDLPSGCAPLLNNFSFSFSFVLFYFIYVYVFFFFDILILSNFSKLFWVKWEIFYVY